MAHPVSPARGPSRRAQLWSLATALLLVFAACSDDDDPPPIGVAPDPVPSADAPLPGVVVEITAVRGGTGPNGNARVGDRLTVDFTLRQDNGEPLELTSMTRGAIMVSGPTFNYQRVIASQGDLLTAAKKTALGQFSYTFTVPIPTTYLEPYNDTPSLTAGELTGQPLLDGTYTVGIEIRKDYTINGVVYRDPGNATRDFLFGGAQTIQAREVVTLANCNQCHGELRGHGNNRNNLTNCLLCHTAGAEDRNVSTVAGGTPGESIDFRVMIHKIHAGKNLPSVNGVTTNLDGSRKYDAPVKPYQLVGFNNEVVDYSHVAFPVWPSMASPMPRDVGFTTLTSAQQTLENTIRQGPVDCAKCHGDPDGDGPLPAPAQGDLIYNQPTRAACGSCHDDWVPELPYRSNTQTMPAQSDDAACKNCHRPSGTSLGILDAHRHPLLDEDLATGVVFQVQSVTDVGGNNDGSFDTGERIGITMRIRNRAGADIAASSLSRIEAVLNGPSTNPQAMHLIRIAPVGLGTGPVYTFNLPQNVYYEPVGTSIAGLQTFATSRAPHWNVSGAATTVLRRTGTGFQSALAADAAALQNYIDVTPGTGSSFARDNYIVLEDAVVGRREFMRIQNVQGDRLWFSSLYSQNYAAGLRQAHALGSEVAIVTMATVAAANYTVDALAGLIVETTEFGNGEILVNYTSDYVVPAVYEGTFNDSPALGESWGNWKGLAVLPGTYSLGIYGARTFTKTVFGENTSYTDGSQPNVTALRFGGATTVQTVHRIDSSASCYKCHVDIQFHGGNRRGVETCLLCHGTAGAEDAATYVYATGAATPGVTIDFRTMLHKIHHGKELSAGANYVVAGFGGNPFSYEHVGYPFMPGGTINCASCHGAANTAWQQPAERNHPAQIIATRSWRAVCGSCHDSSAVTAHIDVNTSLSGGEACAICHGPGKDKDVSRVHIAR